jgi:hypothetical protein
MRISNVPVNKTSFGPGNGFFDERRVVFAGYVNPILTLQACF